MRGGLPWISQVIATVRLVLDSRLLDRLIALGFMRPGVQNPELIRDAVATALAAMLKPATPNHGHWV